MSAASEPLSPELALVCPELASRARAALPDRPWERPLERALRFRAQERPRPAAVAVADPRPGRSRQRSPVWLLGLTLAVALLAFGALQSRKVPALAVTAVPPRPVLHDPAPPPRVLSAAPARIARAAPPMAHEPLAPPVAAPAQAPAVRSRARLPVPLVKPASPRSRARPVARNLAVPYGGYVFPAGGGRLQVAAAGRSIAVLDLSVPCFGHLVLVDIPIASDGRFALIREAAGRSSRFTLRLGGAFVENALHLSLRASGGGCPDRSVAAVGRLS